MCAPDHDATQDLKRRFAALKPVRTPFFLTRPDAECVLDWKLGRQRGRHRHLWLRNSDAAIETVTRAAFEINESDKGYEAEVRLGILCSLAGVGVPVASAFLALVDPDNYAVIDYRGWRQVFGQPGNQRKTDFTVGQYKKYLARVQEIATQLGWQPQEVDLAIWAYDKALSGE